MRRASAAFIFLFITTIPLLVYADNSTALKTDCAAGKACLKAELTSPDTLHVGDTVELVLKYHLPKGGSLAEPLSIHGIEGIHLTGIKKTPRRIIISCLVENTETWETGRLSVAWQDSSGNKNTMYAPAIKVPVRSNFSRGSAPALQDIKEIIPSVPLWKRILPWAVAAAVAAIIIMAGFLLFRHMKGRSRTGVSIPAHEKAMREIKELKAKRLMEKGQYKLFYFRLSEIIRRYIEEIRQIPASEMTTDELTVRLRENRDREMIPLFREMDMVKFANRAPSENAAKNIMEEIMLYVKETSVHESEKQEAAGDRP